MEEIKFLINELTRSVQEEDIKPLQGEYISNIDDFLKKSSRRVLKEIETKERIVIIGDIHNDSNTLYQIFSKLNISKEYDYLNKAVFVFLGDYLDRGTNPLQVLRFILKFKNLLGDRCILLKGNHDNILYNKDRGYYAVHSPHDTLDFLKGLFEEKFILKLKEFFELLPYFAFSKIKRQKYLFVHASIPKDNDFKNFNLKLLKDINLPITENHEYRRLLNDMTWGDASDADFKNQENVSSIRYEYGRKQFEKFMKESDFDFMFRGHDAITDGYKVFYDGRLISLFSSGGCNNEATGYQYIKTPSFGIIKEDGDIIVENIYLYTFHISTADSVRERSKYNILLRDEKQDIYLYIKTNINTYCNDKNAINEEDTWRLFKSDEEFSVEIQVSKNASDLINSNFLNYLIKNIKQIQ